LTTNRPLRPLIASLFFLLINTLVFSQSISGRTLDETGQPLPFATIHVKGTTNGTTSNAGGFFQLRLPEGTYMLVVQFVGYQKAEREVTIKGDVKMDFQLQPTVFQLKEVVVSGKEDPSYRIIREAIKKRKYYEKEYNAYACDVYIKGVQRLDSVPKKIMGFKVTLDTGIVYLSESISKLKFMQPDLVNERMISSKVSGNNRAFSWNMASDMLINMYNNTFVIDGLSKRAFVSPIANNAFLFYDYELDGVFEEDGLLINKIKLLPRRKTDPVFDGFIYIIEDQWRIHSIDALLVKSRGIDFVDSLTIHQVFMPVDQGIWMPFSQRFGFQFKVFGIYGRGYFNAVYSNYQVQPNYELIFKETGKKVEMPDLFSKKEFTGEIMFVETESNQRDSAYWASIRPIPLSQTEIRDYQYKDSLQVVKDSKPYKDSIDQKNNKITIGKIILTGYSHTNTWEGRRMDYPSIINSFQFNAVEGAVMNMSVAYNKIEDNRLRYRIAPTVRYGAASESLYGRLDFYYRNKDMKFTNFTGGFGHFVTQINERQPVAAFPNTFNALLYGNNFMKLFEKGFVYGQFQQELVNGILFTGRLEYANRSMLQNNTNFSFYSNEVIYDDNIPENAELDDTTFPLHQALIMDARLRIRFAQQYITRPNRRLIFKSKYPELHLHYQKGIQALGSDVNFDEWEVAVTDDMSYGLLGKTVYMLNVGGFFNARNVSFVDYIHFNGNRLKVARAEGLRSYQLLDYYTWSTTNTYFEAHMEHHFHGFILNKVPIIKQLHWQEVFSFNYLHTPTVRSYAEIGVGIEHIFKFLRVDYYKSLRPGAHTQQGFRFGLGF
jgi:hypothetical protein